MRFAEANILYLAVPLLLLYILLRWKSKRVEDATERFIDRSLLGQLSTQSPLSIPRLTQVLLHTAVLLLLLLALARPQWGFQWRERENSGIDLVVAVDVSQSMLATDVAPTRLEQARREIVDLLSRLQGDRVALVSFAGVAFAESPLTLDYSAFTLFLNSLSPSLIPVGGTNIEAAIAESVRLFDDVSDSSRAKALLLITDGEEFDGDTTAAFERLQEAQIQLYVLGVGTAEGAPIPTSTGYKKDAAGNVIVSKLQSELLEKLAVESGGVYVESSASNQDTIALYDKGMHRQLEASSIAWGSAKRWNEYYQLPLLFSFLVLLYAWSQFRPPSSTTLVLLCLIYPFTASSSVRAENRETIGQQASQALENAAFEDAHALFQSASERYPDDPRFLEGSAASLYRQGRFEEAFQTYLLAEQASSVAKDKAKLLYNAANALVQLERYQEAVSSYEKALEYHSEDQEIQENLAYAKKLLQQQQSDENQQDSQQQEQKQDSQEDDEQNQQQNEKEQKSKQEQEQSEQQQSQQQSEEGKSKSSEQQATPSQSEKDDQEGKQNTGTEKEVEKKKDKIEEQEVEEEKEAPAQTAAQAGKEEEKKKLSSEDLMQLRSVEEQRGAQIEFRARKAMKQLEELNEEIPTKDW